MSTSHIVDTFHAVDDLAVHPAEVIQFFVDRFAFPLLLTYLSQDARIARFQLTVQANGTMYLKRAERIINCLTLPLTAELQEVGGLSSLTIKLTSK